MRIRIYIGLAPRMTLTRTIRLNKLPEKPQLPGFRQMVKADVPQVQAILFEYLKAKTKLFIEWSLEEAAHWLLPVPGVLSSFVVEDKGKILSFCSFYHLNSTVLGNDKHDKLLAAYSFYNVAANGITFKELISDALVCAYNEGCDVFNCLNLMENETFLKELKFGPGDGNLRYYLYNWACPPLKTSELGIVLL
jgi:glycylpeptide N-tetradecanoyltransferase